MIIIKQAKDTIEDTVYDALSKIGYQPQHERAVIKPCIPSPCQNGCPYITDHRITSGVIDYLRHQGIKEIIVGEGPLRDYERTFVVSGYEKMCKKRDVRLLNLHYAERRGIPWDYGEIQLPSLILDSEYINIAKLKVHTSTTVTLSMKNQMGLLKKEDNKKIHLLGLHRPIAALSGVIKPDMIIIDAINGEQGGAPGKHGQEVRGINLVICGNHLLSTDAAATKLMGFNPENIRHLKIARDIGIGEFEDEMIGLPLNECQMNFIPLTDHRRIGNLYYHWTDETCSGCLGLMAEIRKTVLSHPWHIGRFIQYGLLQRLDIMTGKPKIIQETNFSYLSRIIGIGDCMSDIASKHGIPFVPGCPPKAVDVLRKI
ncbi:MAG: DUF362 domain-containing protein [bacterium]|nr:DUF362 domain-containing protein [bacterium]